MGTENPTAPVSDAQLAREAAAAAVQRGQPTEADQQVEREQALDDARAKAAEDAKAAAKAKAPAAPQQQQQQQAPPKAEGEEGEAEQALYAAPKAEDRQWAVDNYGGPIAAAMDKAGINAPAANAYWQANGKLPESALKKLEEAGYPRPMVNAYLDGVKGAVTKAEDEGKALAAEVTTVAGGAQAYKMMTEWASQGGMTQAELQDFNAIIDTKSPAAMRVAVKALRARYEQANGRLPKVTVTGAQASRSGRSAEADTGSDIFRSAAESIAAVRDPRYQRDPAYRRDVEAKIARSNLHGKARRPAAR
jgi:hypothetical protein